MYTFGTVPIFDYDQSCMELTPNGLIMQIVAKKDGLAHLAQFAQCLVGGVLYLCTAYAAG